MYNSFLVFDFGSNEEAAQQARHKLEGWKQAFRLDKKLLYKFDRGEPDDAAAQPAPSSEPAKPAKAETSKADKSKTPAKGKASSKSKAAAAEPAPANPAPAAAPTQAKLIVRLYFSGHEKMSHQRWLDRIPAEEPFKTASSKILQGGSPGFDELASQFDALD
jgi:hypothetical protein